MNRLVARRVIADKYVLERALAAGGMGSVWSAWNTQLDVPVAIKFMAPPLAGSPDLVARFEREARAAAQLRSPHVVQIFEHGVDDGQPFIVMELLEGEDLGARMRREGRLPLEETARLVGGVCKALRRAHALGIVHRDLKPANIFLACGEEEDGDVIVKVLDFGVVKSIAEAVESGVTKTGELVGTPHYMSPEQARSNKSVDQRSDLWSLAIIAYRALTASLPFPDDEGIEMLMRVCSEHAPPPSRFAPDIAPDIDAFFEKALALCPDDRFQSAREMAEAMNQLAGIPASTRAGRGPVSSFPEISPLSLRAHQSHAYVYTSAADGAARRSTPVGGIPAPFSLRSPRASSVEIAPELIAHDTGKHGGRMATLPRLEEPTRISAAASPRAARSTARPLPVAIVAAREVGQSSASDPALVEPAPILDEISTLSRFGLSRGPSFSAANHVLARPRLALAVAGLFIVFATLTVAFAPFALSHADRPAAPSNKISWTNALGTDLAGPPPVAAPAGAIAAPDPNSAIVANTAPMGAPFGPVGSTAPPGPNAAGAGSIGAPFGPVGSIAAPDVNVAGVGPVGSIATPSASAAPAAATPSPSAVPDAAPSSTAAASDAPPKRSTWTWKKPRTKPTPGKRSVPSKRGGNEGGIGRAPTY